MNINILIPGDFRTNKNEEALKCSVKASDGHLYPLKNSLIFIHKPVIWIKLSEIKFVEFSRIGQLGGSGTSRSFDVSITKMKDDATVTFAGIDKEEQKNLMNYFKLKNVKVRTVDVETNQQIDLSEDDEDEEEEEDSRPKTKPGVKGPAKGGAEEEYDSEEDEDFNEEQSPGESGSDDEDEEASDASMEDEEEDIDEDEVKEMKK